MYIFIANLFARYSCPMWCDSRIIRGICRKAYRWMAENRLMYGLAMRKRVKQVGPQVFPDTYPPLYTDQRFAPWEEVADPDDPKQYNLISCRGGQVIRRPAGYCAHKIHELTGRYPQRITQKRFDAREWVEFLAEAGYGVIVTHPQSGHHYVGVIPDEGEFGLVVWFEQVGPTKDYFCSTYNNFVFEVIRLKHDRRGIIWVQID